MTITVCKTAPQMGSAAADRIAQKLREAIEKDGTARLLLSTGASQFEMFEELIKRDVDWSKVTMFHLDEYVALPETHIASFRKYLKERFVSRVPLKEAVFVNGEGDVRKNIDNLTARLREAPIDVGVIGIGENGHVAFNDPPADFDTQESYIVVELNERCKQQQVGEGWFAAVDNVPQQAISMTVSQIMKCKTIISAVPHKVKADAIQKTLAQSVNNLVPGTILKNHPDWSLYLDEDSASGWMTL